jgi:hypothetical protein
MFVLTPATSAQTLSSKWLLQYSSSNAELLAPKPTLKAQIHFTQQKKLSVLGGNVHLPGAEFGKDATET